MWTAILATHDNLALWMHSNTCNSFPMKLVNPLLILLLVPKHAQPSSCILNLSRAVEMSLINGSQQISGKIELLILDFTSGLPILFVDE